MSSFFILGKTTPVAGLEQATAGPVAPPRRRPRPRLASEDDGLDDENQRWERLREGRENSSGDADPGFGD